MSRLANLATLNGVPKREHVVKMRDDFLSPFQQVFDQTFDDLIGGFFSEGGKSSVRNRATYPRLDSYTTENSFVIEVAIPGVAKEDVEVETGEQEEHGGKYVRISGKMESDMSDKNHLVKELRRTSFTRIVGVTQNTEGDPVALLKDGILRLTWKLRQEARPPTGKIIPVE